MKIVPDLIRLRWTLALLAALLLAAAGIAYGAVRLLKGAEQEHRQTKAQLADVEGRLARARDEEREILSKISRYRELVARGIIGPEDRLSWTERIGQTKAARQLFDVQYELSPQHPLDPRLLPGGITAGGHQFMASTMRLQLQLLHEDDLLDFLADLRAEVQAILLVRGCNLERMTPPPGSRGIQAQLKADCTIDWVTLREMQP